MDCYFRQSWVDRRLAFKGGKETLALSISMLARIWKPDTYFYNGKHSYLHTITSPNKFVRLYQDGRVLYSSRYVRPQLILSYIAINNISRSQTEETVLLASFAHKEKKAVLRQDYEKRATRFRTASAIKALEDLQSPRDCTSEFYLLLLPLYAEYPFYLIISFYY